MNVSLTPELEKLIHAKVASGRYTSASEVVREGLRLLEQEDQVRAAKLKELKRLIQEGLDSGDAGPLDMNEIIAEARRRHRAK